MKKKFELLAPGGDTDSVKAAIAAGANAVYCGLDRFNARNRASNLSFDELNKLLVLAHKNQCMIYLTLNIIVVESEFPALVKLLNKLVNTGIDGVIVQDLGVIYILNKYFENLEIHASTQLTTHNRGQIEFLNELMISRVNLSRELNLNEIKELTRFAHGKNIETEVFVHGSYCIGFSGLCYFSSHLSGNSGNRGRCSQPCRDRYKKTFSGKSYPLNLKDNSAYKDIKKLCDSGVDSLKIEGRIKGADYVYIAVKAYKKQINRVLKEKKVESDDPDLRNIFNRSFSDSFLKGEIDSEMFIDDPRDSMNSLPEKDIKRIYDEKELIKKKVKKKISLLTDKIENVRIHISGSAGSKLEIRVETCDKNFLVSSKKPLKEKDDKQTKVLNLKFFEERFKTLNDGSFKIKEINTEGLKQDLFIPFSEITNIKNEIFFNLNGFSYSNPIEVPSIKKRSEQRYKPKLSVLISSEKDIPDVSKRSGDIFFKLPSRLRNLPELKEVFVNNRELIPFFPSIMLSEDYETGKDFLEEVKPALIVTNNSGIAFEASKRSIDWVAGPFMNIANSFSLLCLKEKFNCKGAFISNELTKLQIKKIIKPDKFRLYYSICHPILLMTSRQCLFHQVTGCRKKVVDDDCIRNCEKTSYITNIKDVRHIVEKSKGNFHSLYNNHNYLNTDAVNEFKGLFTDYLIDTGNIKTETEFKINKKDYVDLFNEFVNGDLSLEDEIHKIIAPSTMGNWHRSQGGF